MRRAREFLVFGSLLLAGCVHTGGDAANTSQFRLLRPRTDSDIAYLEYVVIERMEGADEINRRAWDRVDEQVLSFEARTVLEVTGLRVGVTGNTAPGALRTLIENPRTRRGHRYRTFALDKPSRLLTNGPLPRAEFPAPAANGPTKFVRTMVELGFDLTVREAAEGKVAVRLVPLARYRDRALFLPNDPDGERDQSVESFPAGAFEVTLSPDEFLVVGTDSYWEDTFGHAAFTETLEDRRVQRLLAIRAGIVRAERPPPATPAAAPLASQVTAGAARP
jgi:hypothetical protein